MYREQRAFRTDGGLDTPPPAALDHLTGELMSVVRGAAYREQHLPGGEQKSNVGGWMNTWSVHRRTGALKERPQLVWPEERSPAVMFDHGEHMSPQQIPSSGSQHGFAVIDLETTGLSPRRDRIVEIAVIQTDHWGRPQSSWTTRVNPEGPVGATHIHGMTAADVANAPLFTELVPTIVSLLQGRALVAHNASFDLPFLAHEFRRASWLWPRAPHLCTMRASTHFLPHLSRRRLIDCCTECGIRLEDAHSALGDARATSTLLQYYFDPRVGTQPAPEHYRLVEEALLTAWPTGPAPAHMLPPLEEARPARSVRKFTSKSAPPKPAAWITDTVSLAHVTDGALPPDAHGYAELVLNALADRKITPEEESALLDAAQAAGLEPNDIEATHTAVAAAVADAAWADGYLAKTERDQVKQVLSMLGLDEASASALLKQAQERRVAEFSKRCNPLPPNWYHGEPLRVGDAIAVTGCEDAERSRLEQTARDRGVRVTGSVSKKTKLLVSDGSTNGTKLAAAHQHGTRIVTPTDAMVLLNYIQPAEE